MALACLCVAGCAAEADVQAEYPVVRDSAGITIVEHAAELPAQPEWSVGLEEALLLSADFFRVQRALRLADGRTVVANAGTHQLMWFGVDGTLERAAGRAGEGPGEFRDMARFDRWPGDSLVVHDPQLARASIFDSEGGFARTFTFETTADVPFAVLVGVHSDGSMLATGFTQTGAGGPEYGRHRYPSPAYYFRNDARLGVVLPFASASEVFFETLNGGFRVHPAIFALSTVLLAGPDFVVEAANDTFELRFYTPEGQLAQIVRRLAPPRVASEALRRREIERRLDGDRSGRDPQELRQLVGGMPVPEHLPAYARVAVDRLGWVWVEEYDLDRPPESIWLVFAADGRFGGRVRLPRNLNPVEIGDDYLLGVMTDEFGIEHVMVLTLDRPDPPTTRASG